MDFKKELENLINRCCEENACDTPDFILAEFLVHCLYGFRKGVVARDLWYKDNHWVGNDLVEPKGL